MITVPPIVWKILAGLLVFLGVAGGSAWLMHSHDSKVFQDYKDQQTALAAKQVISNKAAVAAITASEAQGLRTIAASAQESRNEIQKRNDALVGSNVALASTAGRLRARLADAQRQPVVVPGAPASGSTADAASQPALPDGLEQLVKFNSAQFLAADENAVTITALQAVVTQDRAICNGALPGLPGD